MLVAFESPTRQDAAFGTPAPDHLAGIKGNFVKSCRMQIFDSLGSAEADWRAFEQTADSTVFQQFDWLSEWCQHIGTTAKNLKPVIVIGRDYHDGTMLFLLPLAIERRWGVSRLRWLGDRLCDYNAPLLCKDFGARFSGEQFKSIWREVTCALRDQGYLFDLVTLEQMPDTIGAQPNPFVNLPVISPVFSAYMATLVPKDWDKFYAEKVSKKSRQTDRRKLKNLSAEGAVHMVAVDCGNELDVKRTTDALIQQKRRSYVRKQVPDIFDLPGYVGFMHAIARNPNLRDIVHLTRLDVDEKIAGTGLCLCFDNRYHLWMATFDETFGRHSPGRIHLHEMLRYAIDHDMGFFDFTVGDEPYKFDWSDIKLRLIYYYESHSFRGWQVVRLKKAWYHLDTWYHQHESVKRLVRALKQKKWRPQRKTAG